jgi:hypothetical protein
MKRPAGLHIRMRPQEIAVLEDFYYQVENPCMRHQEFLFFSRLHQRHGHKEFRPQIFSLCIPVNRICDVPSISFMYLGYVWFKANSRLTKILVHASYGAAVWFASKILAAQRQPTSCSVISRQPRADRGRKICSPIFWLCQRFWRG